MNDTPQTEIGTPSAFPLVTGSEIVATLRHDAEAWEGLGKHLGYLDSDDEKRNAERVAYLRAAADRIERLEKALRQAKSLLCDKHEFEAAAELVDLLKTSSPNNV